VGLERDPLNVVSITEELLEIRSSGSGLENEITAVGYPTRSLRDTPLSAKVDSIFSDKRQPLGRCSSLADSCHGIWFCFLVVESCHKYYLLYYMHVSG
jgi:hypothetical protein